MKKVSDFLVATKLEKRPKNIVVGTRRYKRFIDYIYHEKHFWQWSQEEVQTACAIRREIAENSLDNNFNATISRAMNLMVRQHMNECLSWELGINVGCGNDELSGLLYRGLDAPVLGMDVDLLSLNQRKNEGTSVCADMTLMPFPTNSFDFAFAVFVFHFECLWPGIDHISKTLRPGGLLSFSFYGPRRQAVVDVALANGLLQIDMDEVSGGHMVYLFRKAEKTPT